MLNHSCTLTIFGKYNRIWYVVNVHLCYNTCLHLHACVLVSVDGQITVSIFFWLPVNHVFSQHSLTNSLPYVASNAPILYHRFSIIMSVWLCVHEFLGWISRKRFEIETRFQWTTSWKWHVANRMVTWSITSRDLERSRLGHSLLLPNCGDLCPFPLSLPLPFSFLPSPLSILLPSSLPLFGGHALEGLGDRWLTGWLVAFCCVLVCL